ncbi:LCP family protein [Streptomyces beihaiensis]|uniref:LCP family protein n=1 Tax=Streptomyces beihaiensis TaxID=2984495 RepID=A0ABT3U3P3_9ACTN|nr:LCP family protein [Streptomyces beihaiensis]MCX3063899.1 LCP family protein [Streptomyces beihaiensis]
MADTSGGAPARRGRRRLKRVALTLLVVVLVLVAYATGLYFWAGSRLRTTDAFAAYPGRPAAGKGTDWLLVGSDSRADLTPEQRKALHVGNDEGRNTDTIMVLHYGHSGPYLVSIPRDSYVPIPGHGKGKINSAYALGGAPLLTRTVEQATGLRLDHYAEVNFLGLVDVVDALDGVTVCVAAGGLHDEKSGADFAAGCRHMNGTQALQYARARYSDPRGDLGRVERQRQLLDAIATKATGPAVLIPPWRLIPFVSAALDALTVDGGAGAGDVATLGLKMSGLARTVTVPVAGAPYVAGVGDTVAWNETEARRLFTALRHDTAIPTFSDK